ncbi:MAG: cyclase family protein [Alphaproteobacteria bacterium]
MGRLVELSREISDGMAGINPRYCVRVRPFSTREDSAKALGGQASFEISEVAFQVPVGTYIDAPYTRDPEGRDIGAIGIEELVLPGLYIDCRALGARPFGAVRPEDLPSASTLKGRAVLFDFGRAPHYGEKAYDESPPFVSTEAVDVLIASGARLVGVDNRSPDDNRDPARPAHTRLLRAEVFIVENLVGLDRLRGRDFRFFAIPLRVKGASSFPVRAFAELLGA